MDADFGFLRPLNIISPKQTYLHLCIPVTWKSQSFSLKEELRFSCYFAILKLTVKNGAQQDLTEGAAAQAKHSPHLQKSHIFTVHFSYFCAVLLLHRLMHSYILSSNNECENSFRTGNTILSYACLLCFHSFGKFTEQEAK